jgi:ABC-type bacteriocin/lantibiotic exporter with double-glycine peptidase domain
MQKNKQSFYILFKRLWFHLNYQRKFQLFVLFILIILTSIAEIFSIGAVIPFLGVLSSPELIFTNKHAQIFIKLLKIKNSNELLIPLTSIFIFAIIISGILRIILLWVQTRLTFAIGSDLSFKVYRNVLYQPYAVHLSRNSSEVISGILSKTNGVINLTLMPATTILSSIFMLLIMLFAIFSINTYIALYAITGISILYMIIIKITKRRLTLYSVTINQESNKVVKALQEGLGGIRDVLIDGTQEIYSDIYRKADLPARRSQANINIIGGAPRYLVEVIGMLLIALIAYNFTRNSSSFSFAVPVLGSLALGAQRMLPILQQLYVGWTTIVGGKSSLIDALDLLDQPVPNYIKNKYIDSIDFNHNIKLSNIFFRYNNDTPWILKNLNLNIEKGSLVGIMGTTGGGKSTLLDIIMALILPSEGQILIDNQQLTNDNMSSWQKHIAHVPQSIFLSDTSISENIAFGIPVQEIDYARLYSAASKAQISDVIETWEKKYETVVGERGIRLSGGQRQRIGIARALYKKADILIFDEATSALDNETEIEVMNSINDLKGELTIIIVAHRLSTLKNCNKIYEINDGKAILHENAFLK